MDEGTLHPRSPQIALTGLVVMVAIGLFTGYWTVTWVREALANARYANDVLFSAKISFNTKTCAAEIIKAPLHRNGEGSTAADAGA